MPGNREYSKLPETDLIRIASMGIQAETAVAARSDFFISVVVPELERRLDESRAASGWAPGGRIPPVSDAIAVNTVWESGRIAGLEESWRIVNTLVQEGKDANAEMALRDKKAKAKKEGG